MGSQAQDKKEFLIFLNKVPRGCITPSSELPVADEGESADNHLRGGLSFIGSKLERAPPEGGAFFIVDYQ